MEKEKQEIILEWLDDPIMSSKKLKCIKTCIENEEKIIYASIQFKLNNSNCITEIKAEKRISIDKITNNELKEELDDIINHINI